MTIRRDPGGSNRPDRLSQPTKLHLADAAPDAELDTCHVGRIRGSEKGDGASNFFRSSYALQRYLRDKSLNRLIHLFLGQTDAVEDGRFDRARRDRVYANIPAGKIRS